MNKFEGIINTKYKINENGIYTFPIARKKSDILYSSNEFKKWDNIVNERIKYYTTKSSIAGRMANLSYKSITQLNNTKGWILDIGCGDGAQLKLLDDKSRYIGIDRNLKRLEILKSNYPQANVMYADVSELPFKNKTIVGIFSSNAFEHLWYLKDTVYEMYRVLLPMGKCCIVIPTEGGLWTLGRELVSKPHFNKKFPNIDFDFISRIEHCNQAKQIVRTIKLLFNVTQIGIPFKIPSIWLNAFFELSCSKRNDIDI
jgi:ubiquinone/menaquinone biosynthesis C-methylase UbiE